MKNSSPLLPRVLQAGFIALLGGLIAMAPANGQQVPDRLNYQGMLRKGDGTPEPAGYKDIEFRIYDAPTAGSLLWARSHRVSLDANGLFNVVLMEGGSPISIGSPRHPNLTSVFTDPSGEGRYLELTVAGSNPILPRQRFVSAAYAFVAADVTQAKENFTVAGSLTVQSGARVNSLTVDTGATFNSATFLGNVGIGTSSPSRALTVNGDMEIGVSSADYQHLRLGGGNSYGYLYGSYPWLGDGIHLGYNYYADASGVGHIHNTGGQCSRLTMGYGTILFATAGINTPPVNRMIVDQNGRIGMGTTLPRGGLEIERGTDTQPALRLSSSSAGQGSGLWLENRSTGTAPVTNVWSIYTAADQGKLIVANNKLSKSALIITTNLNVGIGSASPARLLQIGDDNESNSEGMMRFSSRSGSSGDRRAWDIGVPETETDVSKEGYSFVIDDVYTTGVTEFMIKYANGYVGIGTNNPGAKLHVVGTVKVTGLGTGTGSTVRYNTTTGALGYDSSSVRYKENVRPFETDWVALLNAEPVTYTRPDSPNDWEVGFIAEDFEAIGLGPLVLHDETGRPDAIQYDRITLYLVQIAKAQQKELADKAARIGALEKSVEELRALVNALAEKVENGVQ
jgi:hypothetical protein